jgi:ribosomal-protein-alanine N-acetyltransferase
MIINETKIETVEKLKDIRCNKCGQSCKQEHNFEYATLDARWGYDTKRDNEFHEAHLCESCWEEIVKDFQLSTLVNTDLEI